MNLEFLNKLIEVNSVSGNEKAILKLIEEEIKNYAELSYDGAGNLIAFKKGDKTPDKKLLIDSHVDEVGFIITDVDSDGFLRFATVGGINKNLLPSKRVKVGNVSGVIGMKPIHLCSADERKKYPEEKSLYIDIGAKTREEALDVVNLGDTATFDEPSFKNGDMFAARGLDDKLGVAVLVSLIKSDSPYDFYASFSVQEEVGLRGARCAAYNVSPDFCIVLETTTAADIAGVEEGKTVCNLGQGPVISFMDRATLYDRELYNLAMNAGVTCQTKRAVAGGNNSGAISLTKDGIRTIAVSVPSRYLHSALCVVNLKDAELARELVTKLSLKIFEEL